jgi:hypothetical protein
MIDHEEMQREARQAMIDRVDELLDTDIEGFHTLEILFDSDSFLLSLKHMLGIRTFDGDIKNMPAALVTEQARWANQVKKDAEAYLFELEELKS